MKILKSLQAALVFGLFAISSASGERADLHQRVTGLAQKYQLDAQELYTAVDSVRNTGRLPAKWITKAEASRLGWHPGKPLGRIAPGKSIGGDRFGNREKKLPGARGLLPVKAGRTWFEADLSYRGGKRNAKRLLYSSDRWIFVTADHYQTFERILP
ncbi:MAG TPA: ribonuclease domain-containing protein [Turneriella sp.]|nr:ribonuclease domain-containing protein [Turneriella sp.]